MRFHWNQFVIVVGLLAAAVAVGRPGISFAAPSSPAKTTSLDFAFFKARVEPIFLKHRPGHARCYACHGSGTGPQYLVKLSPGATFWNDEQSRKIFENVSRLVDLEDPMNSRFLIHPLSPMAGGDTVVVHGGGRQFESKQDPDWQTMAKWVKGAKLSNTPGQSKN